MKRILIFTDLDGTLLDAGTYSFKPALPALARISELNIPLILCSSKTHAEIEPLRKELGNCHPFIVENGGAIFIPRDYFPFPVNGDLRGDYWVISLGTDYTVIRRALEKLRQTFRVRARGFGDMRPDEIASLTGLSETEAINARQREYGEPFVFEEGPDHAFLRAIEEAGLTWTRGRFYHIMGKHDKGRAVSKVRELFQKPGGELITIGLGDGLNDLSMLKSTDIAFLIKKEDGSHEAGMDFPALVKTAEIGPAGWNTAILRELSRLAG